MDCRLSKYLFYVVLLILLCPACRVQQLPTVERVHHDLQIQLQYDSISRDHYRYVWLAGDTVHVTDSIFIDRWRVRTDSIVRVDSIPYPVEVPVPGEMTGRQRFLYNSGLIAWSLIIFSLILGALALACKFFLKI